MPKGKKLCRKEREFRENLSIPTPDTAIPFQHQTWISLRGCCPNEELMFAARVFETDFRTALEEELDRRGMSIKELAGLVGISPTTLYKITSGDRDPRFSLVRAIADAFDPKKKDFVAIIAAKFLLDELRSVKYIINDTTYRIHGYSANTMEEVIIAAVRAEKDGAVGIICAPILTTLVERIVDIPVAIIKPNPDSYRVAFESLIRSRE